jgi:hypothetical protein
VEDGKRWEKEERETVKTMKLKKRRTTIEPLGA